MRPFLILIGLSLAAIAIAFYVNGKADTIRYAGPALAWTWYNLVVLTVLCFVCIERPRMRAAERFAANDLVKVKWPEGEKAVQLADLSITGARIYGKAPRSLGERIELELSGVPVVGTIVQIEADAFAISFAPTMETRVAIIRLFYAGKHLKPLDHIQISRVGASVLRRVLD